MTVVGFVLGTTQLLKDGGFVTGDSLKVTAVILGAIATYISVYHPETWNGITPVIQALRVTGGISFVDDRIKKYRK